MPILSVVKNYVDETTLTQTQLDQAFQSVETFINTTKLDSANLQNGAVVTASLAADAVTANKIGALAVTTAKIDDQAVTTTKLADANVTLAKMAAASVDTSQLVDAGVTLAKMAAASVDTSQLVDASVTQAKRAALGQQISSSCGSFQTSSNSKTAVTNLSVTITTTGRPVYIGLIPDGSGTNATLGALANPFPTAAGCAQVIYIDRGATNIHTQDVAGYFQLQMPVGSVNMIDVPSTGTYTYSVSTRASGSSTAFVSQAKLVAYEL